MCVHIFDFFQIVSETVTHDPLMFDDVNDQQILLQVLLAFTQIRMKLTV